MYPKTEHLRKQCCNTVCHPARAASHDLIEKLDDFAGRNASGVPSRPFRKNILGEKLCGMLWSLARRSYVAFHELAIQMLDRVAARLCSCPTRATGATA